MESGPKCVKCDHSRSLQRSVEVKHGHGDNPKRHVATNVLVAFVLIPAMLCVMSPAVADPVDEDPNGASLDPDVVAGKKAIDEKHWADAIKALASAALRDTRNADIQNYLGYAYRNAGQMEKAFTYYERALKLNPRHRGAHEYVGEAYLMVGKLAQAEVHLKALQAICLLPCEELDDLKAKIDRYRREGRSR